jgi:hypothetical protein
MIAAIPFTVPFLLLLAAAGPTPAEKELNHPKEGYRLRYPVDWHLNEPVLESGGPVLLSSVPRGDYARGGILPPGAAEVSVQIRRGEPTCAAVVEDNMRHSGATPMRWKESFGGKNADLAQYTFSIAGVSFTRVIACVKIDARFFLFRLASRDGGDLKDRKRTLGRMIETLTTAGGPS